MKLIAVEFFDEGEIKELHLRASYYTQGDGFFHFFRLADHTQWCKGPAYSINAARVASVRMYDWEGPMTEIMKGSEGSNVD